MKSAVRGVTIALALALATQQEVSALVAVGADGMQHAAWSASPVSPVSTAPNTGMLASVWKVSHAMPDGSVTQYLSDLA